MVTADCMRFLTCSAFGGMTMCSASSTALTEQSECMEVQTPHTRPTYAQTSRGSRSLTMISIPRIIVPVLKASVMTPFSISASMRRCQSYLVGRRFDAESFDVGEVMVHGFCVPESGFGASNAPVPRLYGVTDPFVPFDDCARIECIRSFATHFI